MVISLFFLATAVGHSQAVDGFDPNATSNVRVVVVQPDGKILLGGDFTALSPSGGPPVTRNHIARLNADGTLDMGFNPNANGRVFAILVQADGKILVGGDFNGANSIGGQTRNGIARLDPVTGAADSFDPNATLTYLVQAIAVQADGKILVAGGFRSIGGQTRRGIARLDPTTGLADAFNPNADNDVYAITVQTDGKILAAGPFTSIGGQPRYSIARLDATTGMADSFNPNPGSSGYVFCITLQANGQILAGGNFRTIGGQPRNNIARLDSTTGLADSFDPNANSFVYTIAVLADGKILAGGNFSTFGAASIGGQPRNRIARLDPVTGLADSFDPNSNGGVLSVVPQADGKILVGGEFTGARSFAGQTRNRIARLECGDEAITDGGFENGGIPSSNWDPETSTTFGTPLCTQEICGDGTGTAPPRTGLFWAWFGGIGMPETATLGQTVTIPSGSPATLHFWMRIGTVTAPFTDVLNVRVDGTIVQSFPEPPASEGNYTERVVNLDAFADGAAHQILFEYVGPTNGIASYVVDDVSLIAGGCARLALVGNISTRLRVLSGDNALIGGMIATGTAGKRVIIRAIGPSLIPFGVPGALANPTLDLFQGSTLLLSNDDWGSSPQQAEIAASGLAPSHNLESAVIQTLTPGQTYTAVVRGINNSTGIGVVEAYDLDQAAASKLGNISTRGFVDVDDNVMIAGLIAGPGNGTSLKVLVRALGPTLADFGVVGVLANPTLDLVNSSGTVIRSNDNWTDDPQQQALIQAAGLAPSHGVEAALVETVAPGAYTAIVRGNSRGTGIGLVEAYNIP